MTLHTPNLMTPANRRCDSCGRIGLPPNRTRHEDCPPPPPAPCPACGLQYPTPRELLDHYRHTAGQPSVCEVTQEMNR